MSSDPSEPREANGHLVRELHGITLKGVVRHLVQRLGWEELGRLIPINCFTYEPSIGSSLKFLRRTPWARKEVEDLYIALRSEK